MSRIIGISSVLIAGILFSIFDATIKIANNFASAGQIILAPYIFQTIIILLIYFPKHGYALFSTRRPKLQIIRGLSLLLVSIFAFHSLKALPIGEYTAIAMLTPMFVMVLAAVALKKPTSLANWILIFGSATGAILVIKPEIKTQSWLLFIFPIGMVFTKSIFQTLTSALSQDDKPITTHFYTSLVCFISTSLFIPLYWQPLSLYGWLLLILLGIVSCIGHYILLIGYKYENPIILTPFLYFQIIFSSIIGWLLFGHTPNLEAFIGFILIIVCGLLNSKLGKFRNTINPAIK